MDTQQNAAKTNKCQEIQGLSLLRPSWMQTPSGSEREAGIVALFLNNNNNNSNHNNTVIIITIDR